MIPNDLKCPKCDGDFALFAESFGEFCGGCNWWTPDMMAEPIFIERLQVRVGLVRTEMRVRIYVGESRLLLDEARPEDWDAVVVMAAAEPVPLGRIGHMPMEYWLYAGELSCTFEVDLTPEEIAIGEVVRRIRQLRQDDLEQQKASEDQRIAEAEALAKADRRRSKLAWADARLGGGPPGRTPIPREVRYAVYERDAGGCVDCGSGFDLQYDHIIPLSMGGGNRMDNLQLLCGECNQRKGATLG